MALSTAFGAAGGLRNLKIFYVPVLRNGFPLRLEIFLRSRFFPFSKGYGIELFTAAPVIRGVVIDPNKPKNF